MSALGVDGAEARSRHPSTSSRSSLAPPELFALLHSVVHALR
ncbi:hypothetical protein ACFQ10_02325 [Streptomyces indonesiensis]